MQPPIVLIISDEPEFARALTNRWLRERQVPAFTILGSDAFHSSDAAQFDIAIIGPVSSASEACRTKLLQAFATEFAIVVEDVNQDRIEERIRQNGSDHSIASTIRTIPHNADWIGTVILLASTLIERCDIEAQLRQLKAIEQTTEAQAALGRFMLEMRHTIGNSLTSVLGNAELLLSEPAILSAAARFKLETIRNMGLRMNEIMQRFASLQTEMAVVERQSESSKAQAASLGG